MKLNVGRTLMVGLAFFSICAFWQLYDATVPLMLRDTFHMGDGLAGMVMALDNVLALFLLPLFGHLSDRTHMRWGRRMPYIVLGTLAASLLMGLLIAMDKAASLPGFITALALLLLVMGVYRSPAVALMPDMTPKPLRSKGNAVINLMGALGGMMTLLVISFGVTSERYGRVDYGYAYMLVAVLMCACALAMRLFVKENAWASQAQGEVPCGRQTPESAEEKLPRGVFLSLILILSSVFLWFMGYNAITTAFTKYATQEWGMSLGTASNCLMVATGGAVLSYLPVGILSTRFGRKRMILLGVALLAACFLAGAFVSGAGLQAYVLFVLIGFAWASINVNSYPMVVELSKGSSVGKYTGYYYTFSMAAQIVTPILSGLLLEHVGYHTLFPYAALMVALSFVTMLMTRHGDSRPDAPKSRLETFDLQD